MRYLGSLHLDARPLLAGLVALALLALGCPDPNDDDDSWPVEDDDAGDDDSGDDDSGDDDAGDDDVGDDDASDDDVGDDDVGDDDVSDDDSGDDDTADSIPAAGAAATPSSGIAPLPVSFDGVVAGGDAPLTYHWQFGDGGEAFTEDPSYTYNVPGTFDALFEVTDADGDVDSASVTVVVGSDNPVDAVPALSINASPTSGNIPLGVVFSAASVGGDQPVTFEWDFGDNSTSTSQNPSHQYTSAGTYQATCRVTDADGDYDENFVTIVAFDPNAPPTAPQLTGALVETSWVNVPANKSEIFEPNNRSLWAYDFTYWEGYDWYYSAEGWLDPNGELHYTVAITNEGLTTNDLFWVDLYIDPGYVPLPSDPGIGDTFDYLWGLDGGDTAQVGYVWQDSGLDQDYDSYVVIDAEEDVLEGDENDNVIGPIPVTAQLDWDWYEVELFQGEDLEIELTVPTNQALNWDLDVYGPDALFEAVSYNGAGQDEYIYLSNCEAGPWWVRVYPSPGNETLSATFADSYLIEFTIQ